MLKTSEAKCQFRFNRRHLNSSSLQPHSQNRVNEAFSYTTSQAALPLWHELFLLTWNKSRHFPRRFQKKYCKQERMLHCKISYGHTATTCLSIYMLLLCNRHSSPRWTLAYVGKGKCSALHTATLWWGEAWAVVCGGPSVLQTGSLCRRSASEITPKYATTLNLHLK